MFGVGTPLPLGSAGALLATGLTWEVGVLAPELGAGAPEDGRVEGGCLRDGAVGFGVPGDLDPEVVVEDEFEDELELGELWLGVVLESVVVLELEVGLGVQDSVSEVMAPWTGRLSEETGVPAGMFTLNVYVLPPTTVIRTVQASAAALGSEEEPESAISTAPTRASKKRPLRLLSNCLPSPNSARGVGQP